MLNITLIIDRLDAEKTMNVTESAHFDFTDLDEHFVLEVRNTQMIIFSGIYYRYLVFVIQSNSNQIDLF